MATESDVMYYGQPKADDDLFYAGEEIGYCTRRKLKEMFFGFEPERLYALRLVARGAEERRAAIMRVWCNEMTAADHEFWVFRTFCDCDCN